MLNVITPMRLVRHLAVAMGERRRGGFILCSSLAGLAGTPGNGIYSAAKAFLDTFAEMAWFELGQQGIDVLCALFPLVRTPAMERLGLKFDGEIKGADPADIADEVSANMKNGPGPARRWHHRTRYASPLHAPGQGCPHHGWHHGLGAGVTRGMRSLVIGATGHTGFAVAKRLLTAGGEVTGLVRSETGEKKLSEAGIRVVSGDALNPETIVPLLPRFDSIVFCRASICTSS